MKRLLIVGAVLAMSTSLSAQTTEVSRPLRPVRALDTVSVVDTLSSGNPDVSVVLYSDNTWSYVRHTDFVEDPAIFNEYWNTNVSHAYGGVEASSLPESIAISLVDSLHGYRCPYKGKISSRFGIRGSRQHQGVDLPLKSGETIYAAFDGKVRFSKSSGGYGNLVVIRHNNGLETYYGHLSKRSVEAGDWVVAGQEIGKGGSTGRSTGPHLHFEVRYYGHTFDPERIFDFVKALPGALLATDELEFATVSEAAKKLQPVAVLHCPYAMSWADEERDVTAWLGNDLQNEAFRKLYSLAPKIKRVKNKDFDFVWHFMQNSDHFYYMATKWLSDGDVHSYFNPYGSSYEAFINYMNVLSDFQIEVEKALEAKKSRKKSK
jgi:hypothetical protein